MTRYSRSGSFGFGRHSDYPKPAVRFAVRASLIGAILIVGSGAGVAVAGVGHERDLRPSSASPVPPTTTAQAVASPGPATTVPELTTTTVPSPPPTTLPAPIAEPRQVTARQTVPRPAVILVGSRSQAPRRAPTASTAPPRPSTAPPPPRSSGSRDPSQSIPPSSDFASNCFSSAYSQSSCDAAALRDINSALSGEGYGPLPLPSDYSSLSTVAQLIAVANAERAVRGMPQMPENSNLDSMAYNGARNNSDPTGPSGYTWGSNIAMGYPTALSADYMWMYDDGTNSPNVDCQSPGDSGCWGHRHNILIAGAGMSGAGVYNYNGTLNLTQLFVVNYR